MFKVLERRLHRKEMSSPVLVVIGSGPGIGLSTASIFATRKFDKIALIARDTARLSKDREGVLQAAKAAGRDVEVSTFSQDISETASFQKTLEKIEKLGMISCVFFNAARVQPSDLLTYEEKELVEDFMVCIFPSNKDSSSLELFERFRICRLIICCHQNAQIYRKFGPATCAHQFSNRSKFLNDLDLCFK